MAGVLNNALFGGGADLGVPSFLDTTEKRSPDDDTLVQQVAQLSEENEYLRNYVKRAESELNEYQRTYPELAASGALEKLIEQGGDLPPWIAQKKYISPLLTAYDARLQAMEDTVQAHKDEIVKLMEDIQLTVERNHSLEQELEDDVRQLLTKFDCSTNGTEIMDNNERIEMQERCELLAEDNQLLRANEIELQKKIEDLQLDLHERSSTAEALKHELDKSRSMLQSYEDRLKSMTAEQQAIEQELVVSRNQLDESERERRSLQTELSSARIELNGIEHQARSMRDLADRGETMSKQREAEMQSQMLHVTQQGRQLALRVEELDQALEESLGREQAAAKELENQRKEIQIMLETVESLEKTLTEHKRERAAIQSDINKSRDEISQAQLERDEAKTNGTMIQREMESLLKRHQEQVDELQKSSVDALERAYSAAKQKESNLYNDIRNLELLCSNLENDKAKALREQKSAIFQYERLSESSLAEQNRLASDLNGLKALLAEKDAISESAALEMTQQSREMDRLKDRLERLRDDSSRRIEELCTQLREKISSINDIEQEKLKEQHNIQVRLEEMTNSAKAYETRARTAEEQIATIQSAKDREIEDLHHRLKESYAMQEDIELKLSSLKQQHEASIEKWRTEQRSSVLHFQRVVRELKEESTRLSARIVELESGIATMTRERDASLDNLKYSQEDLRRLEAVVELREQEISDLTNQLKAAAITESQYRKELKDLQLSLDREQIETRRAQRQAQRQLRRTKIVDAQRCLLGKESCEVAARLTTSSSPPAVSQ